MIVMVGAAVDEGGADLVITRINNLKTDEIVKDLLKGWHTLRRLYLKQIKKYQFDSQVKEKCKQLAQQLYDKYSTSKVSKYRIEWHEGTSDKYCSVLIFGEEPYPYFTYPLNLIEADPLKSNIFYKIFRKWPSGYVDLKNFAYFFWEMKRKIQVKFSSAGLMLLKTIFKYVKTKSCIGFPSVPELIQGGQLKYAESTLRGCYRRFLNMGILTRWTCTNYACLNLIPLLKVCENENPTDIEHKFTTWKSSISPEKTLRILVIPEKSSYWFKNSEAALYTLQSRCQGTNVDLFDGTSWYMDNHTLDVPNHFDTYNCRELNYTIERFKFIKSDLLLLTEAFIPGERKVKHIASRTGLTQGYVSRRLKTLLNMNVFQIYYKLRNVGLNERYFLFALGTRSDLRLVEWFVRQTPQYHISQADECIYALISLSSKNLPVFLKNCSLLKQTTDLIDFYCTQLTDGMGQQPNLFKLWNDEKKLWFSELG